MARIAVFAARLRVSRNLPELLDAGFDAFEAIRSAARTCEDRAPELFAAFMMAAGTAVEGRNAINAAPSLPGGASSVRSRDPLVSPGDDAGAVADELAALAGLLAHRLPGAAVAAALAGDRAACRDAARAATQIHGLLARDSDETRAR